DFIREASFQLVMPDQKAHIDRPIERVKNKVEIAASGEFAAVDAALQSLVRLLTSGPQESVAKGLDQFRIRLPSGEQRRHHLAPLGPEDANQAAHLQAHVALYGSGVWETELTVGAGGEGVGDQGGLGRPPTVDSCFANVRVGGNAFNAQF